jgi:hypothetical protein
LNRAFAAGFVVEASQPGTSMGGVVRGLVLAGRDVVELAVAPVVVLGDPRHRRVFDVVDGPHRALQEEAAMADGFGFQHSDRRLCQGASSDSPIFWARLGDGAARATPTSVNAMSREQLSMPVGQDLLGLSWSRPRRLCS